MSANQFMPGVPFKNDRLKTVQDVIQMAGAPLPSTITLASTDGARKIELTTDGVNYFQPTYDTQVAAFINVVVRGNVRAIRLSGAINDLWSVL